MKPFGSSRPRRAPSSGARLVFGRVQFSSITLAAALCIVITLLRLHTLGRFAAPPNALTDNGGTLEESVPSAWSGVRQSAAFDSNDTVRPNTLYRPTWKRWRMHMFHALDDDLLAEGSCVGWRQTMLCTPEGPEEPHYSKTCNALVTSGSGYCLCKHGRRANKVECGTFHFTCAEVCSETSVSDGSGGEAGKRSSAVAVNQPAVKLREGKMLEELEARGRDIKRRLLAQRSLMSVIYPPLKEPEKKPADTVEETTVVPIHSNSTTDAPTPSSNRLDHLYLETEVSRRRKEAAWKATMKEYDQWVKELYDARLQRTAKALGDATCVGWRSSSDCNPDGKRQPELDRGCGAVIRANSHNGGFCECNRDAGIAPVYVGCQHRAFTCKQVCSPLFRLETLGLARGEELQADDTEQNDIASEAVPTSEAQIRNQIEHEHQSSRSFGFAHLRAVAAARQDRERHARQATKDETGEPLPQRDRLFGAAIANALGSHRKSASSREGAMSAAPRKELPYRLPDVLADKDKEDEYYRYLDRVQAEHEKKKRAEVIVEDDKDRL
jgi:hypothetical protein